MLFCSEIEVMKMDKELEKIIDDTWHYVIQESHTRDENLRKLQFLDAYVYNCNKVSSDEFTPFRLGVRLGRLLVIEK